MPGLNGANKPIDEPRRATAPSARSPLALSWKFVADAGTCAVQTGDSVSRATSVTVLSFCKSYTSPIGCTPFGCADATMRCRPPSLILTGPDVVSNTTNVASSPLTCDDRSGALGYTTPP